MIYFTLLELLFEIIKPREARLFRSLILKPSSFLFILPLFHYSSTYPSTHPSIFSHPSQSLPLVDFNLLPSTFHHLLVIPNPFQYSSLLLPQSIPKSFLIYPNPFHLLTPTSSFPQPIILIWSHHLLSSQIHSTIHPNTFLYPSCPLPLSIPTPSLTHPNIFSHLLSFYKQLQPHHLSLSTSSHLFSNIHPNTSLFHSSFTHSPQHILIHTNTFHLLTSTLSYHSPSPLIIPNSSLIHSNAFSLP